MPAALGGLFGKKTVVRREAGRNIHDAWITERFGPDWGENPLVLTVAEQDANLAYATDLGRTMRTTDGGANWVAVYSRRSGENGWVTTAWTLPMLTAITLIRFNQNRQFISTTDIGLFRSEDGGNPGQFDDRCTEGLDEHDVLD